MNTSSVLRISLAITLALLAALAATGGGPAHAATFTVTKTADTADGACDADCSLREAIVAANAAAGADTITLPAGTYTLTIPPDGTPDDGLDGDLDITDDLTINGAGAASTTIDAAGLDGVFQVAPVTAAITDLTITNGASAGTGRGGGIQNSGTLTLTGIMLNGNTAFNGGGIANDSGNLTVNGSTISGNSTTGNSGGGIINDSGVLVLNNTTVSGNSTTGAGLPGGGVANFGGTVTVDNSVISDNVATDDGGGIYNASGEFGPAGPLTITNSTISGNSATDRGGGIYVSSGTAIITASTISGNSSSGFGGGGLYDEVGSVTLTNVTVSANTSTGNGGGVYDEFGSTSMTNVTLSGNSATSGGGIFVEIGTVTIQNTIVANSTAGGDCAGTSPVTSSGNNIDSDGTCGLAAAGDLPSADPNLGPLSDNGGPTQTHALLAGSPAIDTGDDASCPATDQRGIARPIDGDGNGTATCDIGAYEFQPAPTPTPTATPTASPPATATPAQLPVTGAAPASGGSAWPLVIVLVVAAWLTAAGGALVAFRRRP